MATIFSEQELDVFALRMAPSEHDQEVALERLAVLRERDSRGDLRALTERRVEQSFNEKLFAEVFGYRTLLRDGAGHYHLEPQRYAPAAGLRHYTDFSLGFYERGEGPTAAIAELKAPGASLDDPQHGRYAGQSAVQQALATASAAGSQWAIVSNFDELRLYRTGQPLAYETFRLMDPSPLRFRRGYALFSRSSLLGDDAARLAPLEMLYQRTLRGLTMMLPQQEGHVRLVMTCRYERTADMPQEFLLSALSDAIEKAALPEFKLTGGWMKPQLIDDVISIPFETSRLPSLIRADRSGVVTVTHCLRARQSFDAHDLARTLLMQLRFANAAAGRLASSVISVQWALEDLREGLWISERDDSTWIKPLNLTGFVTCPPATLRTTYPPRRLTPAAAADVFGIACEAIRELTFPFVSESNNGRARIEPTPAEIRAFIRDQE